MSSGQSPRQAGEQQADREWVQWPRRENAKGGFG